MQLVRLSLALLAVAAVAGQYVQELHRLAKIRRMPGPQARAYYETTRRRTEWLLVMVTAALALAASGLVAHHLITRP